MNRSIFVAVRSVDISAAFDQRFHDFKVPVQRSDIQRRGTELPLLCVDVDLAGLKLRNDLASVTFKDGFPKQLYGIGFGDFALHL